MKKTFLFLSFFISLNILFAQEFNYDDSWGQNGFNLKNESSRKVEVVFSINSFNLADVDVNGKLLKSAVIPGIFLPNDAGKPDLAGTGRFLAIPKGSRVEFKILNFRTEVIKNVEIAPAPVLPLDSDPSPLKYIKDESVYSKDQFYPENPVKISEIHEIRGIDAVILGVTPFQYNPVKKELIIYKDINLEIEFIGGSNSYGNDEYRSRWWEPILSDIFLNYKSLPTVDFDQRSKNNATLTGYEYVIVIPNGADFLPWADSIKKFRQEQGIKTGIFTLAEIGGNNTTTIKNWVANIYNTWQIKPAAICLMADYGSDANNTIISYLRTHPASYPAFASDNYYADVNNDEMPDIVFSRIAAKNSSDLKKIISRFLDYERTPPFSESFYTNMISALGWQTERWFQLCSETVGGFFKKKLDKNPIRINAIYSGTPGSSWSSATNTSTVVNYFGPLGKAYIPSRPDSIGGFSGGTASQINNAINSGSFLLLHRDHGLYTGWGEPAYSTTNVQQLTNTQLPFIYSINCQTGAYHNPSGCPADASFAEVFIKHTYNNKNSGALGLVCPSEVSYSFVNDSYVWGNIDNMFPNFLPDYGTTPPSRDAKPAFGMTAGKYFLQQSSWPYNTSDKLVTYRLFHMHGDAFLNIFYEAPMMLTVNHSSTMNESDNSFTITTNEGSFIALTCNGEILGTATGTGSPQQISISNGLIANQKMKIVITKQNYYRYTSVVDILAATGNICKTFNVNQGWNIISIPVKASCLHRDSLFANAQSFPYFYNDGYQTCDTLKLNCGYWMKFPQDQSIQICGFINTSDSIYLKAGWNIIGVNERSVNTTNITSYPMSLLASEFYGFNSSYQIATTLEPGKGYWIKATQNGYIKMIENIAKKNSLSENKILQSVPKIRLTDKIGNVVELLLSNENKTLFTELPPKPPLSVFDCRFENNSFIADSKENIPSVLIQSENYPITVELVNCKDKFTIKDILNGQIVNNILSEDNTVQIVNPNINSFKLAKITKELYEFELNNYPNPFNPTTSINYTIPKDGKVSLKIYDVLGKEVVTLVNQLQEKGKYSIEWNASNYSSGIYYYELQIDEYRSVKKMLLMK